MQSCAPLSRPDIADMPSRHKKAAMPCICLAWQHGTVGVPYHQSGEDATIPYLFLECPHLLYKKPVSGGWELAVRV